MLLQKSNVLDQDRPEIVECISDNVQSKLDDARLCFTISLPR